ncbi:MAG: molybdenum cofactor guanylyltransferase MobA [Pseudomonadales bacterium]|nr:molybdenum cofactor guanylyltransferase MobA [Pseudomonadales bacterium]MBP6227796.1 molybdenum cofactor guanylyltransferase MobA [Pseudomonadales bacterium]
MDSDATIIGLILAGGRGRRMGEGNLKYLRTLGSRTLLERALARARPQVDTLLINSASAPATLRSHGMQVVPDSVPGFVGPLAGVLAGMEHAASRFPQAQWLVTMAVDTPWFPLDLVQRLVAQRRADDAEIAIAASGGRTHPVFALWPLGIAAHLRAALEVEGQRKVDAFQARYRRVLVEWRCEPHDPFFNINTPDDLARAERALAAAQEGA